MGFFDKKLAKKSKLKLTYIQGKYELNPEWHESNKYEEVYDLIIYFVEKKYKSDETLSYIERYFLEIHNLEIEIANNNDILFYDSDENGVFGDDQLFIVTISIVGPIIKEVKPIEFLENWRMFSMLRKLDILLYISKDYDKCVAHLPSFQELWKSIKKEK